MASLQLDIVTPDRLVLSKEVDYVGAPGIEGQFGIMANHIPFLSALAVGGLYYKVNEKEEYIFVAGGFAEISDNKVTILAESAEEVATIDLARAEAAKKRAEQRLQEHSEDINRARATSALSRAIHRIHLFNTYK